MISIFLLGIIEMSFFLLNSNIDNGYFSFHWFLFHRFSPICRHQSGTMKYILVTGGVISGIGKGIIASSVGTILKSCGLHVTAIKIDPYINIDAGTFSPYEHGTSQEMMIQHMCDYAAACCKPVVFVAQGRCSCWTTAARWIWIWGTTSASWTSG